MVIDYNYLHDALDRVEHKATVDFFHYQFQTIQSLLAFVHPEIPEYYYASRFVYGLQADYQNFIFRFQPTTIFAAYKLALIYEDSLYLDYFPERELIADENVVQDHAGISTVEEIATRCVENTFEVNNVECVGDSNVSMIKEDLLFESTNFMPINKSDSGEKEAIKSLDCAPFVQQMVSRIGVHQPVIHFGEEVIDQSSLPDIQRDDMIKYITLLQHIFGNTYGSSLLKKIGIGKCKFKGISVVSHHDEDNSSLVPVTSENLVLLRDLAVQVVRGDVDGQCSEGVEVLSISSFYWEPGSNRLCHGTLVSAHRTKEVNQWVVTCILASKVYRDSKESLDGCSRSDIYVELTLFDPEIIYTMVGMLTSIFGAKPSNPKLASFANNVDVFSFVFPVPKLVTSARIYSNMSSSLAFQCYDTTIALDKLFHSTERVTAKQLVWFSVQILFPWSHKYVPLSAFKGGTCNFHRAVIIQFPLADNLASRCHRIFRGLNEGLIQLFPQHQRDNFNGKELSSFSSLSQIQVLSYQLLLREIAATLLGLASARTRVMPWTQCRLKYEFPLLSSTLRFYHAIFKLGGQIWYCHIEWDLYHNIHIMQLDNRGRLVHISVMVDLIAEKTSDFLQCLDVGGLTAMLVTKVECLGEKYFKSGMGLHLSGCEFSDLNAVCTVLLVILNIPCATIMGLEHSLLFGTASPEDSLIQMFMMFRSYFNLGIVYVTVGDADPEILWQRKINIICIFYPKFLHLTLGLLQGPGVTNHIIAECEMVLGFLSTVLVFITSLEWSIQIVHISSYIGTELIVVGQQRLTTKFQSIICLTGSYIGNQGSKYEGLHGAIHRTSAQSLVSLVLQGMSRGIEESWHHLSWHNETNSLPELASQQFIFRGQPVCVMQIEKFLIILRVWGSAYGDTYDFEPTLSGFVLAPGAHAMHYVPVRISGELAASIPFLRPFSIILVSTLCISAKSRFPLLATLRLARQYIVLSPTVTYRGMWPFDPGVNCSLQMSFKLFIATYEWPGSLQELTENSPGRGTYRHESINMVLISLGFSLVSSCRIFGCKAAAMNKFFCKTGQHSEFNSTIRLNYPSIGDRQDPKPSSTYSLNLLCAYNLIFWALVCALLQTFLRKGRRECTANKYAPPRPAQLDNHHRVEIEHRGDDLHTLTTTQEGIDYVYCWSFDPGIPRILVSLSIDAKWCYDTKLDVVNLDYIFRIQFSWI